MTIITFDAPGDEIYHRFHPAVSFVRLALPAGSRSRIGGLLATAHRIAALRSALNRVEPEIVVSFLTKVNVLTLLAAGSRCSVIVSERNNPRKQNAHPVWNVLLNALYRRASAIVMQTAASMGCLPQTVRRQARIIANPIAMSVRREVSPAEYVITAVGRLVPQKGFDLLLEAFATIAQRYPQWSLVIWGEGPLRGSLEQRVRELTLESRVRLPGVTKSPGEWVLNSSVFVLSSRFEGFPNVLGEAMLAGLPVVSFDCEYGPGEMISSEKDGLLVPEGDVTALAAALCRLIDNPDLRSRLGKAAATSASRYAPERVVEQWDQLIREARMGGTH